MADRLPIKMTGNSPNSNLGAMNTCARCGKKINTGDNYQVPSGISKDATTANCRSCAIIAGQAARVKRLILMIPGMVLLSLGLGFLLWSINAPAAARLVLTCVCLPTGIAFCWLSNRIKWKLAYIRRQLADREPK